MTSVFYQCLTSILDPLHVLPRAERETVLRLDLRREREGGGEGEVKRGSNAGQRPVKRPDPLQVPRHPRPVLRLDLQRERGREREREGRREGGIAVILPAYMTSI